ncbi:MAG: hypothetical protein GX786_07160, partial [Clostridiales bacterium]|nr:hypothetical protein [Clostridiales bacterium]
FIDAAVLPKGDCDFYCFYYDKSHKPIGSYFLHAFGITSLPVQKEEFAYFKIGFIGREVFSVNIRELIINPKPKNNLDLLKMEEECFG